MGLYFVFRLNLINRHLEVSASLQRALDDNGFCKSKFEAGLHLAAAQSVAEKLTTWLRRGHKFCYFRSPPVTFIGMCFILKLFS